MQEVSSIRGTKVLNGAIDKVLKGDTTRMYFRASDSEDVGALETEPVRAKENSGSVDYYRLNGAQIDGPVMPQHAFAILPA